MKSMTVRELLEKLDKDNITYYDWETYRYTTSKETIHHDYIEYVEEDSDMELYNDWSYEIVDETGYEQTVLANTCEFADFEEWYGDKFAKVVIIIVK